MVRRMGSVTDKRHMQADDVLCQCFFQRDQARFSKICQRRIVRNGFNAQMQSAGAERENPRCRTR